MKELESRWTAEKALVDSILEVRRKLRAGGKPVDVKDKPVDSQVTAAEDVEPPNVELTAEQRSALLSELHAQQEKLQALQGETPLIMPSVDEQAVSSVVADWTGIPVGRMVKDELQTVLKLAESLNGRVIGQRHGLEMIAKRIQTSRASSTTRTSPSACSCSAAHRV